MASTPPYPDSFDPPRVYDVWCMADRQCANYDPEVKNSWWTHVGVVTQIPFDLKLELADAIMGHLESCHGPLKVEQLHVREGL